ncbi:MAG: PAAR domain-containing protein [Propionivibrio sp.]
MRKHVIRLGDPTTHGGQVVSASATYVINDKRVARMGDYVTCPIPGHGTVTIIEGDPFWTDDGKPIALEGHKCSCGCSLISTLGTLVRSPEGGGAWIAGATGGLASALESAITSTSAKNSGQTAGSTADKEGYDQHFLLTDEVTGETLTNRFYRMIWNGNTVEGYTNNEGLTQRVEAESALEVKIEIYPEGYEVGA